MECCVVVLGMIENSQVMEALYAFYVARAFRVVQHNMHVCGLVDASMFVVRMSYRHNQAELCT